MRGQDVHHHAQTAFIRFRDPANTVNHQYIGKSGFNPIEVTLYVRLTIQGGPIMLGMLFNEKECKELDYVLRKELDEIFGFERPTIGPKHQAGYC